MYDIYQQSVLGVKKCKVNTLWYCRMIAILFLLVLNIYYIISRGLASVKRKVTLKFIIICHLFRLAAASGWGGVSGGSFG